MEKSYYAVIPGNIRYDNELSANAKLLYGEITALCNEKGYCWATNEYFANLYDVSKVSISNWISQLVKKNYLYSEIIYKDGSKEILHRCLKIIDYPIKENFNTPIKENFKENNTYNNNTYNKKENIIKEKRCYGEYKRIKLTDDEYNKLIKEYGKDYIDVQIYFLDQYVESNNNKNKYKNFYLVLLKAIRNGWFKNNKLPTWFDKDIKKEQISIEEQKELDNLLQDFQ